MPKTALSVTLNESNLLWLKGRVTGRKNRSLSNALDQILTEARLGGRGADAARSVVGTVDLAGDDLGLERADAAIRSLFDDSLSRPVIVREAAAPPTKTAPTSSSRERRRG